MGERTDTHQMAVGTDQHSSTDEAATSRITRLRGVEVTSEDLAVTGRCDTVEVDEAGHATVIEYKATPVRRRAEVTEAMVVQLALQTAALREAGMSVDGAAVYFTQHHTRVPVSIGPEELDLARWHAEQTIQLLTTETAPPPLEDDRRCGRCSHIGVCLPDERSLAPVRRRILAPIRTLKCCIWPLPVLMRTYALDASGCCNVAKN